MTMEKIKIEAVEIGLDNAGRYEYQDIKKVLHDGDRAFKIEIPTAFDYEPIYFSSEKNAVEYLKNLLDK